MIKYYNCVTDCNTKSHKIVFTLVLFLIEHSLHCQYGRFSKSFCVSMEDFEFPSGSGFHFVGFVANWEEITEVAICQTGLGKS